MSVPGRQPKAPATLGQRIAHARRLRGITFLMDYRPEDLAEDLGVAPSTVGRWERDERVPREDALAQIARALSVTPAWLRYGVEPPSTEESEEETPVQDPRPTISGTGHRKSGGHRRGGGR